MAGAYYIYLCWHHLCGKIYFMEKNILLTIAYDGAGFSGWQRQPDKLTVQGYLENTLTALFKRDIVLNGCSRTDAGVHALAARASFKAELGLPTEKIPMVVNNALCGREKGPFAIAPIRILDAEEMPLDFHARFDCKGKKYVYKISNSNEVDVFSRNHVYHVAKPLDVNVMKQAAEALIGTHDFKSFESSGGNPRETTVRTIFDVEVTEEDGHIEIAVSGDGFLYNMVRIITGTLVDIGHGKIAPEDMKKIVEAKDRTKAGHTAPPYGLYLAEVYYDDFERR